MKHPWSGLGSLPRGVWILFATTLINRLGTMALPFLVLYLTRSRGFTAGRGGFFVKGYGPTAGLSGPLGRPRSRMGRGGGGPQGGPAFFRLLRPCLHLCPPHPPHLAAS